MPARSTPPSGAAPVRRATVADADVVLAMVRALAAENGDDPRDAGTLAAWTAALARPDVIVLVAEHDATEHDAAEHDATEHDAAEHDRRAVGYVSAVRKFHLWRGEDVLALDDLYVAEEHRDAGLGRLLMAELARLATDEDLVVRWEIREDNVAAQRFYQRLGARLRPKSVAFWSPEAQRRFLAE
ncbi:GNAT family N-acetyltransferase [Blastococcus sp. CCUG 61487]|uniref:GNAT family N-acetyltransferase n=1 Tax=Blastococcus sp. CCUG 61487 TaxID=1840703 RepID=UPI00201E2045|nr:GNAT family N-acetyltransferase [Blastococcus sp. CCUG 61487]